MKKNKDASEGLKNVTHFLMSLIGNPKNPAQYKTNSIEDDYKIRYNQELSEKYIYLLFILFNVDKCKFYIFDII